jgi:seryl-tRNA synthetase
MRETKAPPQRYQEIHGFDESGARGRPCRELPPFGNIQEPNKDVDKILNTWEQITSDLENTLQQRKLLRSQVNLVLSKKDETLQATLPSLRERIKHLSDQIHRLQKKMRKMSHLSPGVAYLQACSEFYMLRQQEEVEARIALEQARCFGRIMGPTVNESQLEKEQRMLRYWRKDADRHHRLTFESRIRRKVESTTEEKGVDEEEPDERDEDVDMVAPEVTLA